MDDCIRRLERQAATGNYLVRKQWIATIKRAGFPNPDKAVIHTPLTEWEEAQKDYDDIAWQGHPWKGLLSQWCGVGCCGYQARTASKLVKGRHMNFCDNWGDNNAKRKTLRTHRDGSRRNYRLRASPR